jgi:Calx-beta domain
MGHLTNVQRPELLPYFLSRDAKRLFGRRGRALASLTTHKAGRWFFGRRGRVLAPPLTVNYATANKTAKAPGDFTAKNGTLTFNPGQPTTQTISVAVKGDRRDEPSETFFVRLSGATNAIITDASGKGTIVDND